jgi:hypothetical protein
MMRIGSDSANGSPVNGEVGTTGVAIGVGDEDADGAEDALGIAEEGAALGGWVAAIGPPHALRANIARTQAATGVRCTRSRYGAIPK